MYKKLKFIYIKFIYINIKVYIYIKFYIRVVWTMNEFLYNFIYINFSIISVNKYSFPIIISF